MKIKKIAETPALIATVINNLESDSATNALSAKQGKELKKLIDELPSGGGGGGDGSVTIIDAFPIGAVVSYSSNIFPYGWLLCDGSAVSRTEFADLFSIIGTTYGAGDGNTTFNIPNYMTRVPVGKWSSDPDFANLGQMGGEKQHTLTTAEMPAHSHTIDTHIAETGKTERGVPFVSDSRLAYYDYDAIHSVGGNQAHNNLQPYIVTNYIIKAKQSTYASGGGSTGTGAPEIFIGSEVPTGAEVLWINEEDEVEPEDINIKQIITTGAETATNEWIDGKQIFIKRINYGVLPNASASTVQTGLAINSIHSIIRVQGMAYRTTDGQWIPLPLVSPESTTNNIMMVLIPQNGSYILRVQTGGDRTNMNATIDIYYTKK